MNKSICLVYIEICMYGILRQNFSLKLPISLDDGEINFVVLKSVSVPKLLLQVVEALPS